MQINRRLLVHAASLVALTALSACVSERPAPVPPPPAPPPVQKPVLPPAQTLNWRDVPLTPGNWSYGREGTATVAAFHSPQGQRLFALFCHRERGSLTLSRTGNATSPLPATILTTYASRPVSIVPMGSADAGTDSQELTVSLRSADPVLDEMAFSRGRFSLEVNGLPTLYLPAHAEIGRVIEDCR